MDASAYIRAGKPAQELTVVREAVSRKFVLLISTSVVAV
jgi:hypothetical protein